MKTKSPCVMALAMFLSWLIAMPTNLYADPQSGSPRAGEISLLIPSANIERGAKTITAAPKSVVDWHDLVNTQVNGRARVALDDGSTLNVGSESSMQIEKHDAGAQQTQLDLMYGKLRSQAVKIARPDGKFEVHTAAGVAGVVGTDFYVDYDKSTGTMTVIAFEGIVRVCNLQGVCVLLKAGQTSSVRNDNNSAPLPPAQASLDMLIAAANDTNVRGSSGLQEGEPVAHHIGKGTWITLGVIAVAVPAIFVPIANRAGSGGSPTTTTPPKCPIVTAAC
jgi:hypothetical protein